MAKSGNALSQYNWFIWMHEWFSADLWYITLNVKYQFFFILLQWIRLNILINIVSFIQVETLQDLYWNIYQKFYWPWTRNTVTISVAGYSKLSIKMASLLPELPESKRSNLLRWFWSKSLLKHVLVVGLMKCLPNFPTLYKSSWKVSKFMP